LSSGQNDGKISPKPGSSRINIFLMDFLTTVVLCLVALAVAGVIWLHFSR
jgi:hypothetical protein